MKHLLFSIGKDSILSFEWKKNQFPSSFERFCFPTPPPNCFQKINEKITINKTETSQVGAISKAQKYSRNNYWKHLEKLIFQKKSHNAEKLKKRPFRLIKRFYKPKTSKKCKGGLFDRMRKFSKKSRIVPKEPKGGTLWSRLYFWKHTKHCGLMRESNPRSASQKISWTNEQKIVKKWTIQSEIVSWKKLPTVIVGLFSLEKRRLKRPHQKTFNFKLNFKVAV